MAVDQKLGTLLRMHEEAFRQLGGVPTEILYDRMERCGRTRARRLSGLRSLHAVAPAIPAQTKGKVESGVKYVRGNFFVRPARTRTRLLGRTRGGTEAMGPERSESAPPPTTHGIVIEPGEMDRTAILALDDHAASGDATQTSGDAAA